ncbi:Tat (twin-arginine translocation) pathway signal sequence [Haladaptatus litoreus]|uniref:Tat (Twin-arginine translocation) pathway signal sequence n=1 Tax=Haladaptatus litoreus TaxID=553468 RepID=A0A1N7BAI9_9EURY|nr:PQQ-binding-like beta-propeller repeat protein [Haladaptatus litoreus]SIR48284.1 Tat (twin-arginine translocation) pathway signal sequence [Haladaptatus litoreus]
MPNEERRTFLKTVGIAVGAAGLTGTGVTLAQQDDDSDGDTGDDGTVHADGWPTRGGNMARNRSTDASGPVPRATNHRKMDFEASSDELIQLGEPVVVGETVYLSVAVRNAESTDGYVAAYDAATFERQWKRDDIRVTTSPTVVDGTAYVGTDDSLFALNAETGETEWKRTDEHLYQPETVVVDGRVYTDGGYAYDAETGELLWEERGNSSRVFYGNETLHYSTGARNPDDGSLKWSYSWHNNSVHTISDGLVYKILYPADGTNQLYTTSADDDSSEWSYSYPDNSVIRSVTVGDGSAFITTWGSDTVIEVDAETGTASEIYELDVGTQFVTLADGVLYVGGVKQLDDTKEAVVLAIDVQTGEEQWRYTLGEWDYELLTVRTPVVVDEKVYVTVSPSWPYDDTPDGEKSTLFALEYSDEEDDSDGQAPEACIESSSNLDDLEAGDTVRLETCSTCYTDEGPTHEWDTNGDGEYDETGHSVEVTVPDCESLEVTLRITDSDGDTDTASVIIAPN